MSRKLPDAQRRQVGDIRVTALSDGPVPLGLDILLDIDEPEYARLLHERHHDPETWRSGLNAFVIETGGKTVLVDAGCAGAMGEETGRVMQNLEAAGFSADGIDLVYATHLHPDHIGGLTKDGAAAFPNAELMVHQSEKDHWSDDSKINDDNRPYFEAAQGALKAYGDRLKTFAGESDVAQGLTALPLEGHTPGHSGLEIQSGNHTLLIWTDIVHIAPVQLARPDVGTGFDVDPEQAKKTRAAILDRVSSDGTLIAGSHIGFPGIGWIEKAGEGYRFHAAPYTHDT